MYASMLPTYLNSTDDKQDALYFIGILLPYY